MRQGGGRVAVVDIGSNSVRLVVYESASRAPATLFNEKVMAGLGRAAAEQGRLDPAARDMALMALARFAFIVRALDVSKVYGVATAAVRAARDGEAFLNEVRALGLDVRLIGGDEEARLSAEGVAAGIPGADGVVGDLGGGSVELVRLTPSGPTRRVSLPLGALELERLQATGRGAMAARIERALRDVDWWAEGAGRPFYTVGGSWRALAHLHMHLEHWPLPVIHHHVMPIALPQRLARMLGRANPRSLKGVPGISSARVGQLPGAALLLDRLVRAFGSSAIIASAYGLREGLLVQSLSPAARREDPLLAYARAEAARSGRLSGPGAVAAGERLAAWAGGVFPELGPAERRLIDAAALLADVAWRAHPDLRPSRARDIALEGGFVGIDARERALVAMALWSHAGGPAGSPETAMLGRLASDQDLARARAWGLALRLGQRLDGGTGVALADAPVERRPGALVLKLGPEVALLDGQSVRRRLKALASALDLEPVVEVFSAKPEKLSLRPVAS